MYDTGNFTPIDDPLAATNRHNGIDGTFAQGINDEGDVVGYYADANGVYHGFLWHNGTYTTIDYALNGNESIDDGTDLVGINDSGEIIGTYVNSDLGLVVGFLGTPSDTLMLDDAPQFTGTISGLAVGDSIDMTDIDLTTLKPLVYTPNKAGAGGTLTVNDGTNIAHLQLLGQHVAAGFNAAPDSGTGTVITYTPPSSQSSETLLATPQHT